MQSTSISSNAAAGGLMQRLLPMQKWLLPAVLAVLGAAVYAPAAWAVFVLDDRSHISQGSRFTSMFPLGRFFERRGLMDFTLAVNYAIDGLHPRGYHILNVIIHLLASLILFGLVRRLLQLPQWSTKLREHASWLALVIAAIWMVHPLQTQAVTYVIQRGESMAGMFVLLCAYALVRLHGTELLTTISTQTFCQRLRNSKLAWAVLCVLAMVCAVWTKESAVTAPIGLLLLDRCLLAKSFKAAVVKRWWLHVLLLATMTLPMLGGLGEMGLRSDVAPAVVSTTAVAQPAVHAAVHPAPLHVLPSTMMLDQYPSAGFGMPGMTWKQYFFTQPAVICDYLKLSFWPGWLSIEHNWRPMSTPWGGWRALDLQLAFAFLVVLAVLSLWAMWRLPWLGLAGCWFFLSLGISSSFIPINDLAVEHRMYLALVSVVCVTVLASWQLAHRMHWRWVWPVCLAGVVIVSLGARTFVRNLDYGSELVLWEKAAQGQVPNERIRLNLGSAMYEAGLKKEAKAQYEMALQLRPGNSNALLNLGSIYFNQRELDSAERYYKQALRMAPRSATAYVFLSRIARLRGDNEQALALLQHANDSEPGKPDILNSIAKMQFTLGKLDDAEATYRQILKIQGPTAAQLTNLGMIKVAQGKLDAASDLFTQATQADPGFVYAWEQLARNKARQNNFKESLTALRKAIAIDPAMRLQQQLAMLLAYGSDPSVKNIPEAMSIVEQALRMTRRQDPAWLEVAAKVALAAHRPEVALQAEIDALALAQQRGAPANVIQQAQTEIARLRELVNKMQVQGTQTIPAND